MGLLIWIVRKTGIYKHPHALQSELSASFHSRPTPPSPRQGWCKGARCVKGTRSALGGAWRGELRESAVNQCAESKHFALLSEGEVGRKKNAKSKIFLFIASPPV